MAVLWPSFLMAGVLEMIVFSVVDPSQLRVLGGGELGWSPTAVYSVAFFVFWAVIAVASELSSRLDPHTGDEPRGRAS